MDTEELHIFEAFNKDYGFDDNNVISPSSTEQKYVEDIVQGEYEERVRAQTLELNRNTHTEYLLKALTSVGSSYSTLDASRTWLCYWTVHSLNILGEDIPDERKVALIKFLKSCEDKDGGYGGGPGQYAHLATTYAAVMCLISLNCEEAWNSIDLKKLAAFLKRMKQSDGSFTVHDGGEADIRGAYTAIAVASICGLLTEELTDGTAEWVLSCETYEGGFGGEPTVEAHGGYAYCGVAVMALLGKFNMMNTCKLTKWLVNRQARFEGGFNGRVNKLVDGCYSFWQGAALVIVAEELVKNGQEHLQNRYLFNNQMLQEFILVACQDRHGGMRDKPDKKSDLYHTCYVLSGLSLAQGTDTDVVGGVRSKVNTVSALFNVLSDLPKTAHAFFEKKLYSLTKKT